MIIFIISILTLNFICAIWNFYNAFCLKSITGLMRIISITSGLTSLLTNISVLYAIFKP